MNQKLTCWAVFIACCLFANTHYAQDYITITTIAGTGEAQESIGELNTPSFNNPESSTVDEVGNIYIADTDNHQIRKISVEGEVTTFAGNGQKGLKNGNRQEALFNLPEEIAADALGQLYVFDAGNQKIRKISKKGLVTTLKNNTEGLQKLVVAPSGRLCFQTVKGIYTITPEGKIDTLEVPQNIVTKIEQITTYQEKFYAATSAYYGKKIQIFQIFPEIKLLVDSVVFTDGQEFGLDTVYSKAFVVVKDSFFYFYLEKHLANNAKQWQHPVRLYQVSSKGVGTFIRYDTANYHNAPFPVINLGKAYSNNYILYPTIKDTTKFVERINNITFLLGGLGLKGVTNGYLASERPKLGFKNPKNIFFASTGDLFVLQSYADIKIISKTGKVTYLGLPNHIFTRIWAGGICEDTQGNVYISCGSRGIYRYCLKNPSKSGFILKNTSGENFWTFYGLVIDSKGILFATDSQNDKIWKIDTLGKMTVFTQLAPTNEDEEVNALIGKPRCLVIDKADNLYVWDEEDYNIKKITPKGTCSVFAGNEEEEEAIEGQAMNISFGRSENLVALKFDSKGNLYMLFEGSYDDFILRKISPSGWVSTLIIWDKTLLRLAGGGHITAEDFRFQDLALDAEDNIYLTDEKTHSIYKLTFPK